MSSEQCNRSGRLRLLVLVPHRDVRLPLRAWSASLFTSLPGAWSFPWAAPLAALNRRLSGDELKCLSRRLRLFINENGGRLTGGPPAVCALPAGRGDAFVFGPLLITELPDDIFEPVKDALTSRFSPLVIGAALRRDQPSALLLPSPPRISFRSCALANMSYCPLDDGYSFEWEIDALRWLPKNAP